MRLRIQHGPIERGRKGVSAAAVESDRLDVEGRADALVLDTADRRPAGPANLVTDRPLVSIVTPDPQPGRVHRGHDPLDPGPDLRPLRAHRGRRGLDRRDARHPARARGLVPDALAERARPGDVRRGQQGDAPGDGRDPLPTSTATTCSSPGRSRSSVDAFAALAGGGLRVSGTRSASTTRRARRDAFLFPPFNLKGIYDGFGFLAQPAVAWRRSAYECEGGFRRREPALSLAIASTGCGSGEPTASPRSMNFLAVERRHTGNLPTPTSGWGALDGRAGRRSGKVSPTRRASGIGLSGTLLQPPRQVGLCQGVAWFASRRAGDRFRARWRIAFWRRFVGRAGPHPYKRWPHSCWGMGWSGPSHGRRYADRVLDPEPLPGWDPAQPRLTDRPARLDRHPDPQPGRVHRGHDPIDPGPDVRPLRAHRGRRRVDRRDARHPARARGLVSDALAERARPGDVRRGQQGDAPGDG